MEREPRVVIIGAGFGGLNLARSLAGKNFALHLVDRNNYHTFQPLLYQVATGFLEANSIANNIRGIFQDQENLSFTMGEARGIDESSHRVEVRTAAGDVVELGYDYLAIATGVETDFFGTPGANKAFTLKSLDDAIGLRNQIVRQFELVAAGGADGDDGELTFAIVGGGATGVELTGAMCDLFRLTLKRQFAPRLLRKARIVLVEALPRLLEPFHPASSAYAARLLKHRGAEVRLGRKVVGIEETGLTLEGGEEIRTRTVIWVAGVRTGGLPAGIPGEHARAGRVAVAPDLSLPGHPEIFVIGDAAAAGDRRGHPYALLAPVAVQQGRHVARQLERRADGLPGEAFTYHDRGTMSTVGRNAAIAELPGGLRFYGYPAWTMWLGLHLVELIGFRNRANVLLDWAWNYATHHQGSGLMQCQGLPRPDGLPAGSRLSV